MPAAVVFARDPVARLASGRAVDAEGRALDAADVVAGAAVSGPDMSSGATVLLEKPLLLAPAAVSLAATGAAAAGATGAAGVEATGGGVTRGASAACAKEGVGERARAAVVATKPRRSG